MGAQPRYRVCSTVYTSYERIYLIEPFFIISLIPCPQLKPVLLVNTRSVWWGTEITGLQNVWDWLGFGISYHKVFWTYSGNQTPIKRPDVQFSRLGEKRKSGGYVQVPPEQQCPGVRTGKHGEVTLCHRSGIRHLQQELFCSYQGADNGQHRGSFAPGGRNTNTTHSRGGCALLTPCLFTSGNPLSAPFDFQIAFPRSSSAKHQILITKPQPRERIFAGFPFSPSRHIPAPRATHWQPTIPPGCCWHNFVPVWFHLCWTTACFNSRPPRRAGTAGAALRARARPARPRRRCRGF